MIPPGDPRLFKHASVEDERVNCAVTLRTEIVSQSHRQVRENGPDETCFPNGADLLQLFPEPYDRQLYLSEVF